MVIPDPIDIDATVTSQSSGWVILRLSKAIVVLTREEFMTGLRRGKWWKRHAQLKERLPK